MSPPIHSVQPLKLPIGVSDFSKLVRGGYTFVDKTLFIEEILETGAEVTLITRPRRFGKTLNLSMLQHFFAARAYGEPTQGLFDGLAISGRPTAMVHQGQYPVILLSLKDIRAKDFDEFERKFRGVLATLYRQYPELLKSQRIDSESLEEVKLLRAGKASSEQMGTSLKFLSELLHEHYQRKVLILLDEYDTPIHSAYSHGFYPRLIEFMRDLFSAALKDNPYLLKAVLTGILRIAKENLFSGLNNPRIVTVLDGAFGAYFGFTGIEVSELLGATGLSRGEPTLEKGIKDWYNGYRFGEETIYNPWSIIGCLEERGLLKPYWINTSGDDILKREMARADVSFKEGLERLIQGGETCATIDPNLVFPDLDGNTTALWSLLLFSGYLTAEETSYDPDGRMRCRVRIPNREIAGLYRRYIKDWFSDAMGLDGYRAFLTSLTSGNVAEFERRLRDYVMKWMSHFDATGREPEKFYQGLALGMMVGLDETHAISSNREAGLGRYDLALFPKDGAGLGIVMEFKQTADASDLKAAADEAVAQIEARRYAMELRKHGVSRVLTVGIAFAGKELAIVHAMR